jgi:FkbM family methyltransferase
MIKNMAKQLVVYLIKLLGGSRLGRMIHEEILYNSMSRLELVDHNGVNLKFAAPNALNLYRATTFSTKEPETLEWIERIPPRSVLWDIGANVGLYSCYAAKARDCRVFAFEPSVFNLELLARNIFSNDLSDRVVIIPLPLTDVLGCSTLNMTSTNWGGALSTFGQSYGHDGLEMRKVFEFQTFGIAMTDAIVKFGVDQPDFIKMDVDGIEHLILLGGVDVLAKVQGILIEINDHFAEQADSANQTLRKCGFKLIEKRHADYFDQDIGSGRHTYNQIWERVR